MVLLLILMVIVLVTASIRAMVGEEARLEMVHYSQRNTDNCIVTYYQSKYREQARVSGYRRAAANLRKQGVPIEVALVILFDKCEVRSTYVRAT